MRKTIKALKRNRKKYQEGGEVALTSAQILQQQANEMNQMIVDDNSDNPDDFNVIAAKESLAEQNQQQPPQPLKPESVQETSNVGEVLAGSSVSAPTTNLLEPTTTSVGAQPVTTPEQKTDSSLI